MAQTQLRHTQRWAAPHFAVGTLVASHPGMIVDAEVPAPQRREQLDLPPQAVMLLSQFGGAEGFELRSTPMPNAGHGEVRIRIEAACVQFTDVIIRKGKYPGLDQAPPLVLGYDAVGVIDQVGPGVSFYKIGDRVAALTIVGSYARYRTISAKDLVPVPNELDAAEAATLVLSWTTAYQLLHRVAGVVKGQRILVQGAAGAVGQALVSLGKLSQLAIWGTARAHQAELVRSLGATPIDFEKVNPREIVAGGFDAVFDGIGEHGFVPSWESVKPGGVLCAFGFTDSVRKGGSLLALGATFFRLRLWNTFGHAHARFYSVTEFRERYPEWFHADLENLFGFLSRQEIAPRVAERIGLEDIARAHRRVETGHLDGKIVVCP